MTSYAKPFQVATVDAAMAALDRPEGARRFLVADEVGLGKTIIAQEIIRRLMARKDGPVRVIYVCSNLSIASQNRSKLLEVLDTADERELAVSPFDRLTLLPATGEPKHPKLHLYTMTPETSVPRRAGARRDGQVHERALLQALVEELWPAFFDYFPATFFVRMAKKSFRGALAKQRTRAAGNQKLKDRFYDAVRRELHLEPGAHVVTELRRVRKKHDSLEVIVVLRNALAAGAIHHLEPDLVIFDEFQRFRDLLNPDLDEAAARIIGRLRGDVGETYLLLLSATPYRLFSTAEENSEGSPHHREFFDLVQFLYGPGEVARSHRLECERLFGQLAEELVGGQLDSERAKSLRDRIVELLGAVMCRTERASHRDGYSDFNTAEWGTDVRTEDIEVFRHLTDSLSDRHRALGVYYWASIPLPMQAMSSHYTVRKQATPDPTAPPALEEADRDRFHAPGAWPHPKQRALDALLPTSRLRVPWIAPSLPWWPMGGLWQTPEAQEGKTLLFSRFRAVPSVVSALTSYRLESCIFEGASFKWSEASERRLFGSADDPSLMALFHPSVLFTDFDPAWSAKNRSFAEMLDFAEETVAGVAEHLEVEIVDSLPARPIWRVLLGLERLIGEDYWTDLLAAWRYVHQLNARGDGESGILASLAVWDTETATPLTQISQAELDQLAFWSIASPGAVAVRSLIRHAPEVATVEVIDFSWNGLRNYFGQRWVADSIAPSGENYRDATLQVIVDGNLESVLDEQLWITSRLRNLSGSDLITELQTALGIRTSTTRLREPTTDGEGFSMRCHVAMPFIGATRPEGGSYRPDELRRSFNSPFWPHVLSTTSVGQEGLDFHAWCRDIVHWDLPRNPVDLEQREGRIQRFAGLSVRRPIAEALGDEACEQMRELPDDVSFPSPWTILAELADERLADSSGLAPWWITPNSDIRRFVFDVPTSRERGILRNARRNRLAYRLALGQPNQEDLVERLGDVDVESVRDATINLSPFFQEPHE